MKVLRGNKDSVMAMLEAFVYDPLINWRLVKSGEAETETALSAMHSEALPPGISFQGPSLALTHHLKSQCPLDLHSFCLCSSLQASLLTYTSVWSRTTCAN